MKSLEPHSILESRTRTRHSAHVSAVACSEDLTGFHAAFAAGQSFKPSKIHRDALLPPPLNWVEMKKHSYAKGFMEAAQVEMNSLMEKDTYKWVPTDSAAGRKLLPFIWVFTYKFNDGGFLSKLKARICVRGDLQTDSIYDDNYAATLAIKTF